MSVALAWSRSEVSFGPSICCVFRRFIHHKSFEEAARIVWLSLPETDEWWRLRYGLVRVAWRRAMNAKQYRAAWHIGKLVGDKWLMYCSNGSPPLTREEVDRQVALLMGLR